MLFYSYNRIINTLSTSCQFYAVFAVYIFERFF